MRPSPPGASLRARALGAVRLTFTIAVAVLAMVAAAPGAWSETDPFAAEGSYPPRVLELVDIPPGVELGAADVRLTDSYGTPIPLTSPFLTREAGTHLAHPPRLAPGEYRIEHPGGTQTIVVEGESGFKPENATPSLREPASDAIRTFPAVPLALVLVTAVTGGLLLVRGSSLGLSRPLALFLGGSIIGGGALLGAGIAVGPWQDPTPDSPARLASSFDPCVLEAEIGYSRCAGGHLVRVLQREGLPAAVAYLSERAREPGSRWSVGCHEMAHLLGELGYQATRDHLSMISIGVSDCSFGYYHGMLETMGSYTDDETFPTLVVEACDLVAERHNTEGSGAAVECAHGAGHAAMWRYNERLEPSLEVCTLFSAEEHQEACTAGAIMEWGFAERRAVASGRVADLPEPRVDSVFDLCDPPYGERSAGCVEGVLTTLPGESVLEGAAWCGDTQEHVQVCAASLARALTSSLVSDHQTLLERSVSLCDVIGTTEKYCGLALGYQYLGLTRDLDKVLELCGVLGPQREACLDGIDGLKLYGTNNQDEVVLEIFTNYQRPEAMPSS